jgi:hypothetical protein
MEVRESVKKKKFCITLQRYDVSDKETFKYVSKMYQIISLF